MNVIQCSYGHAPVYLLTWWDRQTRVTLYSICLPLCGGITIVYHSNCSAKILISQLYFESIYPSTRCLSFSYDFLSFVKTTIKCYAINISAITKSFLPAVFTSYKYVAPRTADSLFIKICAYGSFPSPRHTFSPSLQRRPLPGHCSHMISLC